MGMVFTGALCGPAPRPALINQIKLFTKILANYLIINLQIKKFFTIKIQSVKLRLNLPLKE